MAAERPLLGVGAGGFQASFPPYRSAEEARLSQRHAGRGFREVEDAHSSWIQAFAEGGVPGVLAWLILAGFVLFRAWRAGPEGAGWAGAATAFLVAGLFNTLTAHAAHAVLFGLVLGLLDPPGPDPAPRPAIWTAAAALAVAALVTTGRIPRDLTYYQATDHPDPRVRLSLLEHEPGWRARYQKAVDLDRAGRLAEAVDAYREVLRLRPFHGASLHNLAVVRLKAGAPRDEVEGLLARALEGAPNYYLTHFTLGLRRLEERDQKGARAHFERAAWLNENHPASRYGIAESFLADGDIPGALPHLRRARELGVEVWAALRRDHASLLGDPRLEEFRG
jgi:tetratricopeptide (TPR) repeat protein